MALTTAQIQDLLEKVVPNGDHPDRIRQAFAAIKNVLLKVLTPAVGSLASGTAGRVVYYDANGRLTGEAALAYDASTDTLSLKNVTVADEGNIAVNGTTGTKIGTAADQKLGFFGVTPVVQPANANQAALTNSTAGTYDGTLQALSDPADTPASVDALRDDLVANLIPQLRNNFTELFTLLDAIRTALVNTGLIKGAAA